MDELKLVSHFMRGIVSKIIEKAIYKKFGYRLDLDIDELSIKVTDTKAVVTFGACAEMNIDELKKITKVVESRI